MARQLLRPYVALRLRVAVLGPEVQSKPVLVAAKAELPVGGVVGVPEPFGAFLMRPDLQQLGGFKARAFL